MIIIIIMNKLISNRLKLTKSNKLFTKFDYQLFTVQTILFY